MAYTPKIRYGGELKHYRTKGSKNGVRRYQNPDGSLTAAGYARYGVDPNYMKKMAMQKRITENLEKQRQQQQAQQARINAATRSNSGANGVASREAAQRAGDRIRSNTYGNTLSNRVGRAQLAISSKANKAARDVSRTASNIGRNVSNATKTAGNWLNNTTAPARNAVGTAYNNVSGAVRGAADNVSGAVRGAADNVGNWVGDRREKLEEEAKKVKKRAREVANTILGSESKRDEYNAKADEYAKKAQNPVRSMGYISDTKDAYPSTWFDKDAGLTGRDYSQQIADQQRVYASKEAAYRKKAKDETLKGKVENVSRNAGSWLNDRLSDARNTLGKAGEAVSGVASKAKSKAQEAGTNAGNWLNERIGDVKRAGDSIGGAARKAGEAVGGAANSAIDYATGRKEKAAIDKARENRKRANDIWKRNLDQGNVKGMRAASEREKKFFDDAQQAISNYKNNTLPGQIEGIAKDVNRAISNPGKTINKAKRKVGEAAGNAGSWLNDKMSDARKAADSIGDNVRGAANKAGDAARKAADNASGWLNERIGDVKRAGDSIGDNVRGAANKAGDAARKAADQVGLTAKESKRRAEQFIENFFGGNKKKKKR